MKERPILFNGAMVRAILEGRKTQTRRIVKLRPGQFLEDMGDGTKLILEDPYGECHQVDSPFGKVGDRLWVRESAWYWYENGKKSNVMGYRADLDPHLLACPDDYHIEDPWFLENPCVPSIHMPRWASRITLEITNVRVERLQEMTNEDAYAEGVEDGETRFPLRNQTMPLSKHAFAHLWDSVYSENNWAANPWVWVIEFKRRR